MKPPSYGAPMKVNAFMGKGRSAEAEAAADTACSQRLSFGRSDAVPPRAPKGLSQNSYSGY